MTCYFNSPSQEYLRRWAGRALITTAGVFDTTRALQGWRAGLQREPALNITVMYGTDFGNSQTEVRIYLFFVLLCFFFFQN